MCCMHWNSFEYLDFSGWNSLCNLWYYNDHLNRLVFTLDLIKNYVYEQIKGIDKHFKEMYGNIVNELKAAVFFEAQFFSFVGQYLTLFIQLIDNILRNYLIFEVIFRFAK